MAWDDKPTYAQVETIFRWIEWHMSREEASDAVHWLKEHATRREMSDEIKRLYGLYHSRKLNKEECFNSSIWQGYKPKGEE